jgi:hypothetical protein
MKKCNATNSESGHSCILWLHIEGSDVYRQESTDGLQARNEAALIPAQPISYLVGGMMHYA